MNKRTKKKRAYARLAAAVLGDVSNPPCGFDRPNYRGVLCDLPELTPVLLDTDNSMLFDEETILACKKYRLRYCAYRYGEPDSCLIIVSPVKNPRIYEASYNNLRGDISLDSYKVLSSGCHANTARRFHRILDYFLPDMKQSALEFMNAPAESLEADDDSAVE